MSIAEFQCSKFHCSSWTQKGMWKNLIYIVSYGCWSKEYLKTSRLDMLSIPDRFTSCTFCKHFLLRTGVLHTGQLTMTRHLRRPVALTLAQIAECLAVKLTLHVFTMSRLGFEHPTFRLRSEHSNNASPPLPSPWYMQSTMKMLPLTRWRQEFYFFHLNISIERYFEFSSQLFFFYTRNFVSVFLQILIKMKICDFRVRDTIFEWLINVIVSEGNKVFWMGF